MAEKVAGAAILVGTFIGLTGIGLGLYVADGPAWLVLVVLGLALVSLFVAGRLWYLLSQVGDD